MTPRAPESGPAPPRGWIRHLRSHLLQFTPPPPVELGARACNLLILAAVSLELLRVLALEWLRPDAPLWLLLPGLLAAALLGMPVITGLRWRQLGLRPWPRFPGTPVRTDAQGRYRIHPVEGSMIGNEAGGWDLYVGVSVGTAPSGVNPPEVLPWQDVRVPQDPGTVVVLDFTFDAETTPKD